MMRLDAVAKNVAEKLKAASSEKQRSICLLACQLALDAAPIDSPLILEALELLRQKGVLPANKVEELNKLVVQLDEQYFDLQEKAEDDPSAKIESMRLFSQARAVSALSFAGNENALIAAMEAIYEASATVDDESIFEAVLLRLR